MRYSLFTLIAACVLASISAFANTITFEGEISDQTCQATVNGSDTGTVTLPKVSAARLNKDGTVGHQDFEIKIAGCKTSDKEQKISVRFRTDASTNGGNLRNIAETNRAENVAVQLFTKQDGSGEIDLKNGLGNADPIVTLEPNATDAAYTFFARYISENKQATAGKVTAKATYSLNYL